MHRPANSFLVLGGISAQYIFKAVLLFSQCSGVFHVEQFNPSFVFGLIQRTRQQVQHPEAKERQDTTARSRVQNPHFLDPKPDVLTSQPCCHLECVSVHHLWCNTSPKLSTFAFPSSGAVCILAGKHCTGTISDSSGMRGEMKRCHTAFPKCNCSKVFLLSLLVH